MYRDEVTLLDICKAANNIVHFTEDMTFEDLFTDEVKLSAVLHQFMVIGEAVKRLSREFRQEHNDIPWKEIAGMRDKLIHFYDGVDYPTVWKTSQRDIPVLISKLEPLLPNIPEG